MRLIAAFVIAFSTYSRIPMPQVEWTEENRRYSMCFFPLIGAAVGLCMTLWFWLCGVLGAGTFLRGAVGAAIPLLVTGGIHMDGFMDTMDAVASWQPRERRLEILKDSHTGAFAVIGCAAYLLVMAGILGECGVRHGLAVALGGVISRSLSALALTWFPKAKKDGMLSGFAFSAEKRAVTASCAVLLAVSAAGLAYFFGWAGAAAAAAAGGCTAYYRRFSDEYFGGVTGDLAGWFVQLTELAMLMIVVLGGKIG